ncbi:MAG: hypothetical protein E7191_03985 [Erysipelotrichaceae bacterium]|nr:hypothetical protein [Erysipelotrichaceae bacterium]
MRSVHEVIHFILQQEDALQLLSLQLDHTYIWPILRFKLVLALQKKLGLITTPHDALKKDTRVERYKKAIRLDSKVAKYHKQHDTVIITHDRRVKVNGEERDIYTYPLQERYKDALWINRQEYNNLGTKNTGLIVLEESVLDKYKKAINARISQYRPLVELEQLSKKIYEVFEVEINLNKMLEEEWKHFVKREYRFEKLFKRVRPKQVILVVNYDKYAIICACHKLGIKVIELQHGIIDSYHLGYHYPNGLPKQCFVDELWLFAPYWSMSAKLPKVPIQYTGYSYFHEQARRVENIQKREQVIFLSQGTCGEELVKQVVELANQYPDLHIIYKLHPGEFAKWKERYPLLTHSYSNLEVISNTRDLYEMMKESKYCVGAYSTAIYEALALGCTGILVDVEGVREHMQGLIENELVYVTKQLAEDFEEIQRFQVSHTLENIYF